MSHQDDMHLAAACRCQKVEIETVGPPIVSAACYCASCREAGGRFERLPAAPPVLDADGGTSFILYRKDRVRCSKGREYLKEHRLTPASPTRRVIATCCNSAMFLDFTSGHWLSIYRNRFTSDTPPPEMRAHTGRFILKLLTSWVMMGFRRPKVTWATTKP
ncbi:MAG: GFA family protein [Rhodomicrobium sp.]